MSAGVAGVAQPSRVAWLHTVSSPTPRCVHQLHGRKVKNLICILCAFNIETNSRSSLLRLHCFASLFPAAEQYLEIYF